MTKAAAAPAARHAPAPKKQLDAAAAKVSHRGSVASKKSTTVAIARAAQTTKAHLVEQLVGSLAGMDVANVRNIMQFVAKINQRPASVLFSVYVPDEAPTRVSVTTRDGTTRVGRVTAGRGGIVVIEPKTKITTKAQSVRHADVVMPTALERARSRFESLRNDLVKQSLSLTKAAARMDLTPEGLSSRVDRGEIVAFADKNRKMVPVELIDDEQPTRTVQGLADVIRAAHAEPFRLAVWLLSRSRALGDARPVDELRSGNIEKVVRAAKALGAG